MKKRNKLVVRNHCETIDPDIRAMAASLLMKYDKRINSDLIRSYVCECRRGRAYYEDNVITVPLWAYKKGTGYFTYYVAHELSHILAWRKFRNGNHDKHFYEVFKRLCPEDVQFHELGYKRRSGISYGVKGDLNEALKFKYGKDYKIYKF